MKILIVLIVLAVIVWFAYSRLRATNSSIGDEVRKLRSGGGDDDSDSRRP